jgi:SAM-dependent methyltransferase
MAIDVTNREGTQDRRPPSAAHHRVCPWWLGYFLVSPLRRLIENPERILEPHVRGGMRVLEVGSGMGFFSLPLARMVGEEGRVLCLDLQPRMLAALERRARRAGLLQRIEPRRCSTDSLAITDCARSVDLAVLFHVLHEIPDAPRALAEVQAALKPGGRVLLIEPKGHVSQVEFEGQIERAKVAGLSLETPLVLRRGHGAVLRRAAPVA